MSSAKRTKTSREKRLKFSIILKMITNYVQKQKKKKSGAGYQLPFRAAIKQVIVTPPIKSDSKHNSRLKHLTKNTYQLKKNFSFVLQKVGRYLFTSFGGSENAGFDVRRRERTPTGERLRHLSRGQGSGF